MKLYFDHLIGKQSHMDLLYSFVSATFEDDEWQMAFDNGWTPCFVWWKNDCKFFKEMWDAGIWIWYQGRTTRIKTLLYKPSRSTRHFYRQTPVNYTLTDDLVADQKQIYEIYLKYCEYHKFGDVLEYEKYLEIFNKGDFKYLNFYYENKLIAITRMSVWKNVAIMSDFFWWDYENPELSVGKLSQHQEVIVARENNFSNLYLGLGYERESAYKARKSGFEFWTGRKWSNDKELYFKLCEKDVECKTIDDLYNYHEDYLKLLDV